MDPEQPGVRARRGAGQRRGGAHLPAPRGGQPLQRRVRGRLPRQWPEGGRVLRKQDRAAIRGRLGLLRLPPDRAGRHRRRPLHRRPALRRQGARQGARAPAAADAGADLRRADDRLRAGAEALLQRHPLAALGGLRRGPHGGAPARLGCAPPRHAADQRQCARRAALPQRAGPRREGLDRSSGAAIAGRGRPGGRRGRRLSPRRRRSARAPRRGARGRRLPAGQGAPPRPVPARPRRRRSLLARARRQHRRRPAAGRGGRRRARARLSERRRLGAGLPGAAQGRRLGRVPALHRPRQAGPDRRAARMASAS